MTTVWTPFAWAALIGAIGSALAQAGTQRQSRMADLISALVAGCLFGTFALFLGRWVLALEAALTVLWVVTAQTQRRSRSRQPE